MHPAIAALAESDSKIQSTSWPIVKEEEVVDRELVAAVKAVDKHPKWLENNSSKTGDKSYTFFVNGAGHSRFQVSLDEHRKVVDFLGMAVMGNKASCWYKENSKPLNLAQVLDAISKPSGQEMVDAFYALGLTEG